MRIADICASVSNSTSIGLLCLGLLKQSGQHVMDVEGRYGLVLVTAGSEAEAQAIAQTLVSERLAACVNLFPVQSTYRWQGEVHQDAEWQLLIKTDLRRFTELEARIRALHSYEVPEIIALPIQTGSMPYMAWLAEQTTA